MVTLAAYIWARGLAVALTTGDPISVGGAWTDLVNASLGGFTITAPDRGRRLRRSAGSCSRGRGWAATRMRWAATHRGPARSDRRRSLHDADLRPDGPDGGPRVDHRRRPAGVCAAVRGDRPRARRDHRASSSAAPGSWAGKAASAGPPLGVAFIAILNSGLLNLGLTDAYYQVYKGAILLSVLSVQIWLRRVAETSERRRDGAGGAGSRGRSTCHGRDGARPTGSSRSTSRAARSRSSDRSTSAARSIASASTSRSASRPRMAARATRSGTRAGCRSTRWSGSLAHERLGGRVSRPRRTSWRARWRRTSNAMGALWRAVSPARDRALATRVARRARPAPVAPAGGRPDTRPADGGRRLPRDRAQAPTRSRRGPGAARRRLPRAQAPHDRPARPSRAAAGGLRRHGRRSASTSAWRGGRCRTPWSGAAALDDLGLAFIEDPFPPDRWRLTARACGQPANPHRGGRGCGRPGRPRGARGRGRRPARRRDRERRVRRGARRAAAVAAARGSAVMTHAFPDHHAHLAGARAVEHGGDDPRRAASTRSVDCSLAVSGSMRASSSSPTSPVTGRRWTGMPSNDTGATRRISRTRHGRDSDAAGRDRGSGRARDRRGAGHRAADGRDVPRPRREGRRGRHRGAGDRRRARGRDRRDRRGERGCGVRPGGA